MNELLTKNAIMYGKNRIIIYAICLSLVVSLFGCKSTSSLEKANQAYDLYQFNTALEMYRKLVSKEKDRRLRADITYKIGHCYRQMGDYSRAESFYKRAAGMPTIDPEVNYYHGDMLKRLEKYEEAIVAFNKFNREVPGDPRGEMGVRSSEDAIKWKNDKTRYVVESFRPLNSRSNDFAPMFYINNSLVFTSDREESKGRRLYDWTNQKHTDIYIAENEGKRGVVRLAKPVPIDEDGIVNTNFNEGVATFDRRFNTMFYTQCNGKDGEGHNCQILVIRKRGKVWGQPEVMPFCTDSFIKYGHPSLSPDGNKLFFASNMPGGYGEHDIWVSSYVRRGKTWGDPVNLGPVINTSGNDFYPFIHTEDRLYFSSDGHPGMGGLDIFYSDKVGDEWTTPVNLKHPVNSGADDFSIIVEPGGTVARGYSGYFASNRGSRVDNIYRFYMTPLKYTLSGTIFNLRTKEVIPDAVVTLIINDTFQVDLKSDPSGAYRYDLEPENEYSVQAFKRFHFDSEIKYVSTVGLEFSEDFIRDLYLDPFLPIDIELEGIYYDLDKYVLRPEAMVILDSLYHLLINHPYIVIELGSHTDCRATYEYNQVLSENRAKSVVEYLEYKGIPSDRMIPIGYGESQIANGCTCEDGVGPGMKCTDEQHQQNRRTTFRIVRTDYVYRADQLHLLPKKEDKRPAPPKEAPKKKEEEDYIEY